MRVLVFAGNGRLGEAALEAREHLLEQKVVEATVLRRNARDHDPEAESQIEFADLVLVDPAFPAVAEDYREAGLRVELLGEHPADPEVDEDATPEEVIQEDEVEAEPEAEPREGEGKGLTEDDLPPGYAVDLGPPWWTVRGPDGSKVGKSQRSLPSAVRVALDYYEEGGGES